MTITKMTLALLLAYLATAISYVINGSAPVSPCGYWEYESGPRTPHPNSCKKFYTVCSGTPTVGQCPGEWGFHPLYRTCLILPADYCFPNGTYTDDGSNEFDDYEYEVIPLKH